VTLKELRNDQWVDERIYPELQQMFDDARAEGIYPLINESYRSAERQQEILDNYIAAYEAEGLSTEEAQQRALEVVAKPGTSEHQLGLALDIIVEYEEDSTQTWQWLKENCWRYGFILRYPEDKTEITGISYEPWHFRYVGAEAAQQITERGITLEEYLEDKDAG
jgi:D-alanyl-D-alanine carboxypeptidase